MNKRFTLEKPTISVGGHLNSIIEFKMDLFDYRSHQIPEKKPHNGLH